MKVTSHLNDIRSYRWRDRHSTWGLVPTMGALHEGHISLIRQAKIENDNVCVSIFVNPIQFNKPADLKSYPVDLERDLKMLKKEKVDLVWTPTQNDIYPPDFQTYIQVEDISTLLEGKSRPGHFRGVATIVAILFNACQPNRAYFGQKDAQQLLVIRQMVTDLKFNLDIVSCPTIREEDGLAISSRNRHLSPQGRQQAVCLFKALSEAKESIERGERESKKIKLIMHHIIHEFSLAKVDYISIANPLTLAEIGMIKKPLLISLAVTIEDTRLIDNMLIE
jgi:pantoate--beta-alanine ligase